MYWKSKAASTRGVAAGNAVSMPLSAIDLRKIERCKLIDISTWESTSSSRVIVEKALFFESFSGREFALRAGPKQDISDLDQWHRHIVAKLGDGGGGSGGSSAKAGGAENPEIVVREDDNDEDDEEDTSDDTLRKSFFAPIDGE